MAWNFQFLDTFAHYTLTEASAKSKWTQGAPTVSGGVSDDSFQTANIGTLMYKTFVGYASQAAKPQGRIVAVRAARAFNYAEWIDIVGMQDSVTLEQIRLQCHDSTGQLRILATGGTILDNPIQVALTEAQKYNLQLAVWYNGAGKYDYEVRVDGVTITALTSSGTLNAVGTPGLDMLLMNPQITHNGMNNAHWVWTSQYTNSGGKFATTDFMANAKRGVQFADADGLFAATVVGAKWTPSSGTDYFSRINETLASQAQYIKTTTDPNSAPTVLDRASVQMANVDPLITSVLAVQRSTLIHAEVGTGDVRLFTRVKGDTNPATLTFDTAITPPSSPTIVTKAELVDPRDGVAWTRAKLDSLERGIETFNLT